MKGMFCRVEDVAKDPNRFGCEQKIPEVSDLFQVGDDVVVSTNVVGFEGREAKVTEITTRFLIVEYKDGYWYIPGNMQLGNYHPWKESFTRFDLARGLVKKGTRKSLYGEKRHS